MLARFGTRPLTLAPLAEQPFLCNTPGMARGSEGQIGVLAAEISCERCLSCTNNVVHEGHAVREHAKLRMLGARRAHRWFVEWAPKAYAHLALLQLGRHLGARQRDGRPGPAGMAMLAREVMGSQGVRRSECRGNAHMASRLSCSLDKWAPCDLS